MKLINTKDSGNRILKVNHAGEFGAICIYTGQIHVGRWTARSTIPDLKEFREHERQHHDIFWKELQRRKVKRCKSYMLCGLGGYFLGVITALFGQKAIYATTMAVENVVLGHLRVQVSLLKNEDPEAVIAIEKIIEDETLHRDSSASKLTPSAIWLKLLTPVVTGATESVIWLGMKL